MALRPLQAQYPLGQFDCIDALVSTVKGGEVITFGQTTYAGSDKAAKDAFDGYVPPASRPYLTLAGGSATARPLMLADDGIAGYGTIFGSVVGGTVGQVSTGGAVLGPSTATGSGKLTAWDKPGLYAVSLDAVETTNLTGLVPNNTSAVPGANIYFTSGGLLTLDNGAHVASCPSIGSFVEFATNGSLVTTPNSLVGAFSPPDGALTTRAKSPTFVVFAFNPPSGANAT